MVVGWWVTVEFYLKYKMLWDETKGQGVPIPIHEKNQYSKQESA